MPLISVDPPKSKNHVDHIHYLVKVMPLADRRLPFLLSILGHALKYGYLTDKQREAANTIIHEYMNEEGFAFSNDHGCFLPVATDIPKDRTH